MCSQSGEPLPSVEIQCKIDEAFQNTILQASILFDLLYLLESTTSQQSWSKQVTIRNKIWQTGEWPTPWTQSLVIPLPKKGNLQQCQNYRTISLICHSSKVMLKITLNRLKPKAEIGNCSACNADSAFMIFYGVCHDSFQKYVEEGG